MCLLNGLLARLAVQRGSLVFTVAAACMVFASTMQTSRAAPFMIVGNDDKLLWDDQGKPVLSAPG